MFNQQNQPIVVTTGRWQHVRFTRVYHRHYPETSGEGVALRDAVVRLVTQLTRALDCAQSRRGRDAIAQALADVRTFWADRARVRLRSRDAAAGGDLAARSIF